TIDTAVEATRIGAIDFLEKPITLQKLLKAVAAGLARPVVPGRQQAAPRPAVEQRPDATGLTTTAAEPVSAVVQQAPSHLGSIPLDQPLREARDEFERIYFEYHLVRENHSMTRVSEK